MDTLIARADSLVTRAEEATAGLCAGSKMSTLLAKVEVVVAKMENATAALCARRERETEHPRALAAERRALESDRAALAAGDAVGEKASLRDWDLALLETDQLCRTVCVELDTWSCV